jgi:HlyD family secretion protein
LSKPLNDQFGDHCPGGIAVSGTIAKLNADFNSRVHKGDIVALIDPALFKGSLLQATADLKNAQANLVAARANLEKANAALVQTKADYDRAVGLTKDGVMSQQQLDLAKSNYEGANASVDARQQISRRPRHRSALKRLLSR